MGNKLTCSHCGEETRLPDALLSVAGPHIKASCPLCGKYIKFIPRSSVPANLLVAVAFQPRHRSVVNPDSINSEDAPF